MKKRILFFNLLFPINKHTQVYMELGNHLNWGAQEQTFVWDDRLDLYERLVQG